MAIRRNEVRITKVYVVEVGEFHDKHDPTPNWTENHAPVPGAPGATPPTYAFSLRIEAEAGREVGAGAAVFNLYIHAACLTNPWAAMAPFGLNLWLVPLDPLVTGQTFVAAGAEWEYDASEDKYTKSWNFDFPRATPPGPLAAYQKNEVYQFFVTLVDTAAIPAFASTAASEPFLLL